MSTQRSKAACVSRRPAQLGLLAIALAMPLMAFTCTENIEPVPSPPTYYGTTDKNNCGSFLYHTRGWQPHQDPGSTAKLPLFIYWVGTQQKNTGQDSLPADAVAQAMARRGFVSLIVGYDSQDGLGDEPGNAPKLTCMYNRASTTSLISRLCGSRPLPSAEPGLPNVDCDARGIAMWGHSLGGAMAVWSAKYAPKTPAGQSLVRAAFATGIGTNVTVPTALPQTRVRVVNGANDFFNGWDSSLQQITAMTKPASCPSSPADECTRTGTPSPSDALAEYKTGKGSGWVRVPASAANIGSGHCWFISGSAPNPEDAFSNCPLYPANPAPWPAFVDTPSVFEPDANGNIPASAKPWSLKSNADWLGLTAWANPPQ